MTGPDATTRQSRDARIKDLRVAVTGAAGFIGRHLTTALDEHGVAAAILTGDVRDPASFAGGFDVLFHLATVPPATFKTSPELAAGVAIGGLDNAIEASKRTGGRIVFTSSASVYAPGDGPRTEDSPLDPRSSYAAHSRSGR